jgi:sugar/nucleoside kinase (ribokinase family)
VSAPSVVVVGDATLDVHVRPMRPMAAGSDVPAEIAMRPGGQGANLAVRLARQGTAVTLICVLADDAAARMVRTGLAQDGVRIESLMTDTSGVVVVIGGATGERTMLSDRAALPPDVADSVTRLGADWLILSGYALLQPDATHLASRLAAMPARRVLVGCAAPDDSLEPWRAAARLLRPDLVIANRDEAAAARLEELGTGLAVTDATGATATLGDLHVRADVAGGRPAVDTTGAGDAFAAAFVATLASVAWPPPRAAFQEAVERGVALASAVVGVPGAQTRVAGERAAILDP